MSGKCRRSDQHFSSDAGIVGVSQISLRRHLSTDRRGVGMDLRAVRDLTHLVFCCTPFCLVQVLRSWLSAAEHFHRNNVAHPM